MHQPDPYRVLELDRSARVEVIEAAFVVLREIALRDDGPGSARRLVELNTAHAILSDPVRRARHDDGPMG